MKFLLPLFLCTQVFAQTLTFTGPYVCEYDSINPFTEYRFDVVFIKGADTLVVPGHFAADGDAANTSAQCGDQWRVHFNAPSAGAWQWKVFFSRGPNVAINGHSTDTIAPHGEDGIFFAQQGRKLSYVGRKYRQWNTGEYLIKVGTDSPETLMAYSDFDGTRHQNGTDLWVHDYAEHIQDWQTGDPTWQGDKGKGLIGAVNYLHAQGLNAYSCVIMNIEGDGKNCWPFTSHDILNRIDVSKLEQWRIVTEYAGSMDMHWQVKLGEMENHILLNNNEWRVMYRELISRFAHLPALTWNLGEEYFFPGLQTQLELRSAYIRETDPYANLLVLHNLTVLANIFDNPAISQHIDGASLQIGEPEWTDSIMSLPFISDTSFVIANDEQGPSDFGVIADGEGFPQTQEKIRKLMLYPVLLNGCEGFEAYFGYDTRCTDLDCDDFRSREQFWGMLRTAKSILQLIDFWNARPLPEIVNRGYCFGNNRNYLVYSDSATVFHPIDTGEHSIRFIDIETGEWISKSIPLPDTLNPGISEWIALIIAEDIPEDVIHVFSVENRQCAVQIAFDVTKPGIIEESNDMISWQFLRDINGSGRIVDQSPSLLYRLSVDNETRIHSFTPCVEPQSPGPSLPHDPAKFPVKKERPEPEKNR